MQQIATDLRHLADEVERLAFLRAWPAGAIHEDIANARSIAEESLGTLDALGWPEDALVAEVSEHAEAER